MLKGAVVLIERVGLKCQRQNGMLLVRKGRKIVATIVIHNNDLVDNDALMSATDYASVNDGRTRTWL